MISDDTYKNYMKDMLKELNNDKNSMDILLEKKFLRDKEEEVEEAESVDEQGDFRRSMPQQPSKPKSTDPYERRREQLTRNVNAIARERISQTNQQKYLNTINQKK